MTRQELNEIYRLEDEQRAKEAKEVAATLKVGDHIGFKSDVEQCAEITKINRSRDGLSFTVKAPPDGFSGSYIGRCDFYEVYEGDLWID